MDDVFAASVMSAPVHTIDPDATLQTAASRMLERDSGSLVITDDGGAIEGILTATDCMRACADAAAADESTVAEYMGTDLTTAAATDTVGDLAAQLAESGVHHLPVVESEEPIGIVTTTDLTRYVAGLQPAAAPAAVE